MLTSVMLRVGKLLAVVLAAAAGLIQDAAVSAVALMARPAVAGLAEDARREAAALAAGIAAAGLHGDPG